MTSAEITTWLENHSCMKSKRDYIDSGNKTLHLVRFENGDTYEHHETYNSIWHKTTETLLNHVTVDKASYTYSHFSWKRDTVTI